MDRRSMWIFGLLLSTLWLGCSDRSVSVVEGPGDTVGYTDATDVVVTGDGKTWIVTGDPDQGTCIQVGDQCLDIPAIKQKECGDANAQADIVVVAGKLVEVVCYPPQSSGVTIDKVGTTTNGTTEVPQNQNNAVITFDPATDGKPAEGNVVLNSENISLIGNGIDKTILKGNLTLDSNNAHVRGLTVNGNLLLDKNCNGGTVAFVKVTGDLTVNANNVVILNSFVFGNLIVNGQSVTLVNVGVLGNLEIVSPALLCESNYKFADANSNGLVEPAEKGAALECKVKQ